MQISFQKRGRLSVLAMTLVALCLPGSPVRADRAADIGHRVLRERIAHDAHDRYGIRFTESRVQRRTAYGREIVGRGSFYRHHKSMQWFKYHVFVNSRNGSVSDIGYKLH